MLFFNLTLIKASFSLSSSFDKLKLVGHQTHPLSVLTFLSAIVPAHSHPVQALAVGTEASITHLALHLASVNKKLDCFRFYQLSF